MKAASFYSGPGENLYAAPATNQLKSKLKLTKFASRFGVFLSDFMLLKMDRGTYRDHQNVASPAPQKLFCKDCRKEDEVMQL
jgi:hypothetical protein